MIFEFIFTAQGRPRNVQTHSDCRRAPPQADLLKGVETCYLTLQGLQLYPALRGEKEFSDRIPVLFTPAVPAAASDDEMDVLR